MCDVKPIIFIQVKKRESLSVQIIRGEVLTLLRDKQISYNGGTGWGSEKEGRDRKAGGENPGHGAAGERTTGENSQGAGETLSPLEVL